MDFAPGRITGEVQGSDPDPYQTEITFPVYKCTDDMTISVFTTRVDTIFGATSIQLAPEHPIVKHWSSFDGELAPAVEQMIAQLREA